MPQVAKWRQRRKISPDRQHIVLGHLREIRIGEGRVIARTVAGDPVMQGAIELLVAPGSQTGIAIRRQIRRINPAEGGVDSFSPGERFCGIGGVATSAIGSIRQRLAARDDVRRGLGLRFARD
jgi:hypothetical protein